MTFEDNDEHRNKFESKNANTYFMLTYLKNNLATDKPIVCIGIQSVDLFVSTEWFFFPVNLQEINQWNWREKQR